MLGRESARYHIGQQGGVVVGPSVEHTSEMSRDNSMVHAKSEKINKTYPIYPRMRYAH